MNVSGLTEVTVRSYCDKIRGETMIDYKISVAYDATSETVVLQVFNGGLPDDENKNR